MKDLSPVVNEVLLQAHSGVTEGKTEVRKAVTKVGDLLMEHTHPLDFDLVLDLHWTSELLLSLLFLSPLRGQSCPSRDYCPKPPVLLFTKVLSCPGHFKGDFEATGFSWGCLRMSSRSHTQSQVALTSPSSSFWVVISSVYSAKSGAGITDDNPTSRVEHGSDVRTSVFWSPATSLLIAGGALDPLTPAHINLDKFAGY